MCVFSLFNLYYHKMNRLKGVVEVEVAVHCAVRLFEKNNCRIKVA